MYIKEILEKIDNMEFTLENKYGKYKVTIRIEEDEQDDNIQVIIYSHSSLGVNTIFNETFEYDDVLGRLYEELHEQNLEDIENEIYDSVTPTQEELLEHITILLDYEEILEDKKEYIKKELEDMTIYDDEKLVIKSAGMATESGNLIYDVVLRNDSNVDRHVCYI